MYGYAKDGWPQDIPQELNQYQSRCEEIGIECGCLMWGICVIIPETLQSSILQSLHDTHPGIVRMKAIARSYFWWKGLDQEIETLVKSCLTCQAVKSAPASAPPHPMLWPNAPWGRIHRLVGPFLGKMFLIIMDAHSKWPEVIVMPSTTSQTTIETLQIWFLIMDLRNKWYQIMDHNLHQKNLLDLFKAMESGIFHVRLTILPPMG